MVVFLLHPTGIITMTRAQTHKQLAARINTRECEIRQLKQEAERAIGNRQDLVVCAQKLLDRLRTVKALAESEDVHQFVTGKINAARESLQVAEND